MTPPGHSSANNQGEICDFPKQKKGAQLYDFTLFVEKYEDLPL